MAANKQTTIDGDLNVTGSLDVYGEINKGVLSLVKSLAGSPPSAARGVSYTSPALFPSSYTLTSVPTAPALHVTPAYKANVLSWDHQIDLANFQRYELQVSADNSTWYDLSNNMTTGLGTLGALTRTATEIYVHVIPVSTTLYYRVRRVNFVSAADNDGAWSTVQQQTSGATVGAGLAASTIYAALAVVGDLIFSGKIGSQTNPLPVAEDLRVYFTSSGDVVCKYFDGVQWWIRWQISGTSQVAQFPLIEGPDAPNIDGDTDSYDFGATPTSSGPSVDMLFVTANSFALQGDVTGQGQTLYDVSIHGKDEKNRTYSFGKSGGAKIVDSGGTTIHDVPDAALLSNAYYMGHLIMVKPTSPILFNGTAANPSTLTIDNMGNANVKGVRVYWQISTPYNLTSELDSAFFSHPHISNAVWDSGMGNDYMELVGDSANTFFYQLLRSGVMDIAVDVNGQLDVYAVFGSSAIYLKLTQIGIWA